MPLPAIVLIIPDALTLRIVLLPMSAIYMLPLVSAATPVGPFNIAEVADPPSPL